MTNINKLPVMTTTASAGDLLPLYVNDAGATYKLPLSALLTYVEENFASPEYTTVTSSAPDGGTLDLTEETTNQWVILSPSSTIPNFDIALPLAPIDGQQVVVVCGEAGQISSLGWTSPLIPIAGEPTGLGPGGFGALRYSSLTNTWFCVAQSLGANSSFTTITVLTAIADGNGNEQIKFTSTASAVNEFTVRNAATGNAPALLASGTDANIDIALVPKGSGSSRLGLAYGMTSPGAFATVAALTALYPANAANKGLRSAVSDSNQALTAGIGAVVAGGGANVVPVFCDGTNWRIC